MVRINRQARSLDPTASLFLPRQRRGQFAGVMVKLTMMVLTVVVVWGIAGKPLYGFFSSVINILPQKCGLTGKSQVEYQDLMLNLIKEEKIKEMERVYHEYTSCELEPLSDESHFQIGKASFTSSMKVFDFITAPIILRDYVKRVPVAVHKAEAENLIKQAETELEKSPITQLKRLAQLETQPGKWPEAKQGYRQLIDELAKKPNDYQRAFGEQEQKARTRYIRIEADQFREKNPTFKPGDTNIDAPTGNIDYTVGFEKVNSPSGGPLSYKLTINTAGRSVEKPTESLLLDLTRETTLLPLNSPADALDIEANSHTASALLDRIHALVCADTSTVSCGYASIGSSASTVTGKTLLPIPVSNPGIVGPLVSFKIIPTLPTTSDQRSAARFPQFEATSQGKLYTMSILVTQFPTTTATISWRDGAGGVIGDDPRSGTLSSPTLTRGALNTLCPTYHPAPPQSRDMTGELIRCLASRQIFATPYTLRFTPVPIAAPVEPTPPPEKPAPPLPAPEIKPAPSPGKPPEPEVPQPLADLTITGATMINQETGTVGITIKNNGQAPTPSFDVHVLLDGFRGRWHHTIRTSGLGIGQTKTVPVVMPKPSSVPASRDWECLSSMAPSAPNCARVPAGDYFIDADVDKPGEVDETDDGNNDLRIKITLAVDATA